MALPVEDQAFQQIRPAQEGRIGRRRAAEHDMVAAARAGVAPVKHEFVGAEPAVPRGIIQCRRRLDGFAPGIGRMHVDFDDAGVGCHLDEVEARIDGGQIAFDMDGQAGCARAGLCRRQQFEIIFQGATGGMKMQ